MYNENNSTSHTSETDSAGGSRTVQEETKNKEAKQTRRKERKKASKKAKIQSHHD